MTHSQNSSRRQPLQGHAAADTVSRDPASAEGSASPASAATLGPVPPTYLMRLGRRAMACEFEVLLNAGQYDTAAEAAVEALDLIDRLESQLTVYRDTSEVSRLNRTASHGPVEVEARLFALLQLAALIHQRSGGAHDITSGPLTKAWGFYRRAGRVPSDEELAAARSQVGCQRLNFDAERRTLQMPPGMEINLGSIGKGYALDRAAESLATAGVGDFLLHGGQSSVLARGSRGLSPFPESRGLSPFSESAASIETAKKGTVPLPARTDGWTIGLRHPLRPGQRIGEIRLRDRALGTSGAGTQFFFHEGRRLGHILDPRTGRPAEGTLSATVLARTGAEADALSTAFYVLGPVAALAYCRQHSAAHGGLAAILLTPGPRPGAVETITWGLAAGDWQPAAG